MIYGKKFKALMNTYPQFNNLSNNHFSRLAYKELRTIAKVMRADGFITTDYTHDKHDVLAHRVHEAVVKHLI